MENRRTVLTKNWRSHALFALVFFLSSVEREIVVHAQIRWIGFIGSATAIGR